MCKVIRCNDIKIDNIKLKRRVYISNTSYRIYIKYLNNDSLILQTPYIYIPFGITTYNTSKYLDIPFNNESEDETIVLRETIIAINDYIRNMLLTKDIIYKNTIINDDMIYYDSNIFLI